jgi:hypothetical protein
VPVDDLGFGLEVSLASENDHIVILGEQDGRQRGSDESGAASDDNSAHANSGP